jgi:P27 family predicted phage terminase small subunit
MGLKGKHSVADVKGLRALRSRLDVPADFDEAQTARWKGIVDSLAADFFRPADVPLLRAYVIAATFFDDAAKRMKVDGIVLQNERGNWQAHPAHAVLTSQASAMAQLAVKLRLCPSSRYQAITAQSKVDNSPLTAKPWELQKSA